MSASDKAETVLLVNEQAGTVHPYSSVALTVSTGSKKRVMRQNLGSLIVYRDGSVFRLEDIRFLGLWGDSVWERAFSFANGGTRRISVTQLPLTNLTFADVRGQVIEQLRRHPEILEDFFDTEEAPEKVLMSLANCSSCQELFDILRMPEPQDTLDELSGT